MKAGMHKKQKYIPVKDIISVFDFDDISAKLLLPFHAITGLDSTSFISGHSKKTAFHVFLEHKMLLEGFSEVPLSSDTMKNVESFVCKIYKIKDTNDINAARVKLFKKAVQPELLPPTRGTLEYHIKRAHIQSAVWRQATSL